MEIPNPNDEFCSYCWSNDGQNCQGCPHAIEEWEAEILKNPKYAMVEC